MWVFGNIARSFRNLKGRMTGCEECVFCKDRANWKEMMGNVCVSDTERKVDYELHICKVCFSGRPESEILHSINAGVSKINNFRRSFGAAPEYSDADQELIMSAVKDLKKNLKVF